MSSLTLSWWLAVFALAQYAFGQATIHFFPSGLCSGSHLSCGNIPANGCCSSDSQVFASAFLVGPQPSALTVYSHAGCAGPKLRGGTFSCIRPSFAFQSARWSKVIVLKRGINGTEEGEHDSAPKSEACRRPDKLTIVNDDGEEVVVHIPKGKNDEFEHAFAKGDFAKIFEL